MAEAVVEFDYSAEQEDELTLHVGDVIKWWEGELNGKKGMFPENFVRLKPREASGKKEEKREATQRKSVRELANKIKDGVPMPGAQGSAAQKKKETVKNRKCKVMFDYKPENEDELELGIGQIIDFNKEVEDGWWEGSLNGKTGVFMSNFVEMIEEGDGEQAAPVAGGEKDENFQEIKGKKIVGVGLGNIFQGGPIKLRNTAKKSEPSKPSKAEEKEPRVPATNAPDVTKREKQNVGERAVVRYSYAAEQPDELSLKEGEVIRVLDKHLEDEGWWKGEVHGKVGVFPDNFVEIVPLQEEDVDKSSDGDEGKGGSNHVQPEKPTHATKEHKHISSSEIERSHRHHTPADSHMTNSGRDPHESRNAHTAAPPPRPPEPSRHHEPSHDAGLARVVEELQREVRELRSQTVSRSELQRLKQDFDAFRTSHAKKLRELMMEVDDEKKLRLNTQVEMERVKKLVAETHV